MDLYETSTQSFVLRVWVERPAEPGVPMLWRGHVTHVPSGRRRYVQSLDTVVAFISGYINAMGGAENGASGGDGDAGAQGGGVC